MAERREKKKPFSPILPWKTWITISFVLFIASLSRRSNGTINRWIFALVDFLAKVGPRNGNGVKVSDIIVDSTRNVWFRLFVPTKVSCQARLPVIVFIHGGAFTFFSPDYRQHDALCRQFALINRAVVVSVNYRLSPEYKFPAACDDVFDTLKFLEIYDGFPRNVDLSRCFLAGDSAGGNIAHHVARRFAEAESEFSELKVIGLIAMQPYLGGEERTKSETRPENTTYVSTAATDWHWKAYLPEGANRDHAAANVFGPNSIDISGLKNFPDTLVFVGGFDLLHDWQKRYYKGLKTSGVQAQLVKYPKAIHGFYAFPELPEAPHFHCKVAEFILDR